MAHRLDTARLLAQADPRKPNQSHLKRAMSAIYYSLFDTLARNAADTLGASPKSSKEAWIRIYRAVDHSRARNELKKLLREPETMWSAEVRRFASEFVEAQARRHKADYDPYASFTRQEVLTAIATAEAALGAFYKIVRNERLELLTRILFKDRE